MARITGPLHSDSASGRFAKSLVFATWKGIAYARQLVIPSNPKSASQTGNRSMWSWLSKYWNGVPSLDKATWDSLASSRNISAFNAFMGENMDRWQTNKGYTKAFPAAELETTLNVDSVVLDGIIFAVTGHEGYASMGSTPDSTGASDGRAVVILRDTSAISTFSWTKAVKILAVEPGEAWTFTDSPLAADTYHYKVALFGTDGLIGAMSAATTTATVT